ncbi:MAG: hypothetical protein AB7G05_05370 [Hyphomonadaceae bacterium]
MIALAAAAGVCVALALTMLRLFAGPTLYDRAWAGVSLTIKAALICAALAAIAGRAAWAEAAIVLAACAFVTAAAVMRFFRARSFQASLLREGSR